MTPEQKKYLDLYRKSYALDNELREQIQRAFPIGSVVMFQTGNMACSAKATVTQHVDNSTLWLRNHLTGKERRIWVADLIPSFSPFEEE